MMRNLFFCGVLIVAFACSSEKKREDDVDEHFSSDDTPTEAIPDGEDGATDEGISDDTVSNDADAGDQESVAGVEEDEGGVFDDDNGISNHEAENLAKEGEETSDLSLSENDMTTSDDMEAPDTDTTVYTLTITSPANNSSHPAGSPVHFAGATTCFPATVSFVADGQWPMGSVQTTSGSFTHDYTFNTPGVGRVVTVTATGSGCSVAGSVTITITAASPDNPLDVPYFCQYENSLYPESSCQNTSVAMVLRYYGWNGTPDTITAYWGKDHAQSPSGLAEVFNYYAAQAGLGVSLVPHTTGSFAGLKALLDKGKPVIVHGYFTQYGHVVVTVGYDATGYFANDPAGQWSQVYQGGYTKYCDYGYSGKSVHYGKAAFEQAIGPDNTLWYHEVVK